MDQQASFLQQQAGMAAPTGVVELTAQQRMIQQQQAQQQAQLQAQQRLYQSRQVTAATAAAHAAQQQAIPPGQALGGSNVPGQGEMVNVTDGNDMLRAAKRHKPTDRSLPLFLPFAPEVAELDSPTVKRLNESNASLQRLSASYRKLVDLERKVDWNVLRSRIDLGEVLAMKSTGVPRKLRVHVKTSVRNQPWQVALDSFVVGSPKNDQDTAGALDKVPDPYVEVSVTVEYLGDKGSRGGGKTNGEVNGEESAKESSEEKEGVKEGGDDAESGKPDSKAKNIPDFARYIKKAVISNTCDPLLFPGAAPVEWTRPADDLDWAKMASDGTLPSGLTTRLYTTASTTVRVALYLDHQPERFSIVPALASVLDMHQGDRVSVLQALWSYIKLNRLQDDDRRHVRCDARLKPLFANQDKVPFHHLPEYINRYLTPTTPTVIEIPVPLEAPGCRDETLASYDVELLVQSPLRLAKEAAYARMVSTSNAAARASIERDDAIALSATQAKTLQLKRNFFGAFASDPLNAVQSFIESQAHDLSAVVSRSAHDSARGATSGVGVSAAGSGPKWAETLRRSETWQGEWLKEGANVYLQRETERIKTANSAAALGVANGTVMRNGDGVDPRLRGGMPVPGGMGGPPMSLGGRGFGGR